MKIEKLGDIACVETDIAKVERVGDLCIAECSRFSYKQAGNLKVWDQIGKLKSFSRRRARVLLKLMIKEAFA